MRLILAFVTVASAIICASALLGGDTETLIYAGPVALIAAVLLWVNLRDPTARRRTGHHAAVSFEVKAGDGVQAIGTYARVQTDADLWSVALDRAPQAGDQKLYGVRQGGWVWLGEDGLPEKVKVAYGTTWRSWSVLDAAGAV